MLLIPPSLFVITRSECVPSIHVIDLVPDGFAEFVLFVGIFCLISATILHQVLVIIEPPCSFSIHVVLKESEFLSGELNIGQVISVHYLNPNPFSFGSGGEYVLYF